MRMTELDTMRLLELFQQVQQRQQQDDETTNYKDAPALQEMAGLIRPYVAKLEEMDGADLADLAAVCRFLGSSYRELCRGVYGAEFFTAAFRAMVAGSKISGEAPEDGEELFRDAVKTRNWYVDDACEDLKKLAADVMAHDSIEKAFAEASRRTLKRDPVEMTPQYLAVIDEVERKVAENMTTHGRGSCHERWALTREFLEEEGIHWRSQGAMNPGWRFD